MSKEQIISRISFLYKKSDLEIMPYSCFTLNEIIDLKQKLWDEHKCLYEG